jgi:thiol-disulfide isomerase/thioredoxin
MKIKTFLFVTLILLAVSCANDEDKSCVLKGTVHNRESQALLLVKSHEDARYMAQRIPITENNTFEFVLRNAPNIRYSLIFEDEYEQDAFMPVYLFPDNDTIYFNLHSNDQYANNTILGSDATEELLNFEKDVRVLFEQKFNAIYPQLDSLFQLNEGESDLAKHLKSKLDSIGKAHISWRLNEIETKPSIAKYSMLIDFITASQHIPHIDRDYLTSVIYSYQERYPNHFYTELYKNLITAMESIIVGGEFVNFSTVDSQGNEIEFADYVKENKITILNLWAPWCGPCRRTSRELIPFYEKYKDKGFAIFGVVGGIKDIEAYNVAIEQEKFPWKNYVEIKNQNKIWEKYNISNSGGQVFVINNEGTILAIRPRIEELENILIDNL